MDKTVMERNLHNKIIISQALNYKKQGYTNIKASQTGNSMGQPAMIAGYTPDMSAELNQKTVICEVVAAGDSINDDLTIEKWKAFDRSGYNFHLIVPNNFFDEVKQMAKCNGITIDKYWCSKNY